MCILQMRPLQNKGLSAKLHKNLHSKIYKRDINRERVVVTQKTQQHFAVDQCTFVAKVRETDS